MKKRNRMERIRAVFILILSVIGSQGIITALEKNAQTDKVLGEEVKKNQDYL